MNAWFRFKGESSEDYGIWVTGFPDRTVPQERVTFVTVPGRSGALTLPEGTDVYDDLTLSIDCYIANTDRLDEIAEWLRGRGDLVLGSSPARCYKARVTNQIAFRKLMRGKRPHGFSVVFRCAPFQYETEPETIHLSRPGTVANPGSVSVRPMIVVSGSGQVVLNIAGTTVTLSGLSGKVTLDCDAKYAYAGDGTSVSVTLNDHQWPVIPTGASQISWSGGVSMLEITPYWRWI